MLRAHRDFESILYLWQKNFNSGFSCEVYWVYYNPKLRKKQQGQQVLSLNLIFTVKKQLKITLNVFVNKVKLPSSVTNESASSIPNSLFKTRIKVSGIQIPLFQENYFQLQSCKLPPPPHTPKKKNRTRKSSSNQVLWYRYTQGHYKQGAKGKC